MTIKVKILVELCLLNIGMTVKIQISNPGFKTMSYYEFIFLTTSKILAKDLTLVFICKF